MSLSQEPALSALKNYFVCGVKDISDEPYAGASGSHDTFGQAVNTTNGAGPHNIQIFMLAADGTVLNCLPGFWSPQDLYQEISLALQLNEVWLNQSLARSEKERIFRSLQMSHISQHSPAMTRRSHLQSFDLQYEREHKPNSDFLSGNSVQTVDVVMHERMAARPFVAYEHFDVAKYSDYGKPMYDKQEDFRDARGNVDHISAGTAPKIGNVNSLGGRHNGRASQDQQFSDPKLWSQGQPSQNIKLWGQNQPSVGAKAWGVPASY